MLLSYAKIGFFAKKARYPFFKTKKPPGGNIPNFL